MNIHDYEGFEQPWVTDNGNTHGIKNVYHV